MPTASYQQPNDYNLVKDIRPFDMPYQAYMQEISSKQQYWKAGADRIKSVYDQAAGLDPQYTQGKEYLKSFMQNAQTNLEKLSKSDLSIIDNSNQVVNVFKPLFDTNNPMNASLLMDSQLNQHYKKQQQLSDLYRTKDNGKEWNINNEIYYRDAQNKYLQDAKNSDYSTIASNFQNKKSFIPYYDGTKEITDIQEACKGYSSEVQTINQHDSGYLTYSSTKGCDPQRLALAYQTGLSDRFKQQAYIDGYAHFKGNEDTLLKKYNDIAIGDTKNKIDKITTAIAGLRAGKIGKEEQLKINDYTNMLNILQPQYDQALKDYNSATKGNPLEYIKNNYERLAGQIYFNELTNHLGESFRTDDNVLKLLPNAVEMQQRKINGDLKLHILDNKAAMDLATLNHEYKADEIKLKAILDMELEKAKGGILFNNDGIPVTGNTLTNPSIKKITENDYINNTLTPAEDNSNSAYSELTSYIQSKYGKDLPPSTFTMDGLASFVNEHNGKDPKFQDDDLTKLYDNFKIKNIAYRDALNDMRAINAKVKAAHPELFDLSKIDGTPISKYKLRIITDDVHGDMQEIPNPPSMSQRDMYRVLSGEKVNGFEYRDWTHHTMGNNDAVGDGYNKTEKALFYNGKRVDDNPIYTKIGELKRVALDKFGENANLINTYKTAFYTPKYYSNGNFTTFDNSIKEKTSLDQTLKTLLRRAGGQNEKNGYAVLFRDKTGEGIYVQPLDEKNIPEVSGSSSDPILRNLVGKYDGADVKDTPGGKAYYIPGILPRYNRLSGDQDLIEMERGIDRITNLRDILENDPRMINESYKDSKDLPDGTITMITGTGKDAIISIIRGKSTGYTYSATIGDKVIKASSPQELKNILNRL